jgi:membrane protease YdiL (CAAX protease family)
MLLVVHVNGWWKDVGFRAPQPSRSIFLLWLPALYIAALIAFGMFVTPPTASVMAIVAINTLVVGFSEELAFRGVLWGAVRRFMPFWSGFLLVCAAFGSIHILNGFLTGEWGAAAAQSVNAAASGAAYLAFRIRNRSIIPIMVIHWLWDFAVFIVGAGSDPVAASAIDPFKSLTYSAMLVGPILLCGLFLIRNERVRAGWRDDSLPGA